MTADHRITAYIQKELSKFNLGAHTYDHTMRVYYLSQALSEDQQVNRKALEAAALLHDIGRPREEASKVSHSILSGEMSRALLKTLDYSSEEIELVVNAIRSHRFSENIEPTSLEGQILSDADKLDAIGAVGIYRAIAQAVISGVGIEGFLKHADEKLLKLKDMMYTPLGRQIADSRHRTLEGFVEQLRKELEDNSP